MIIKKEKGFAFVLKFRTEKEFEKFMRDYAQPACTNFWVEREQEGFADFVQRLKDKSKLWQP